MKAVTVLPTSNGAREDHILVPLRTRNALDISLGDTYYLQGIKVAVKQAFRNDILAYKEIKNLKLFISRGLLEKLGLKEGDTVYLEEPPKDTSFLIGADPEFILYDTDEKEVIHANKVINKADEYNSFGYDAVLAEVRPEPAKDPEDLVKNIRTILYNPPTQKLNRLSWLGHCYIKSNNRDYPVGSHIHIDNNKDINKQTQQKYLYPVLNKILDELVAVPLTRLDGKDGHYRRAACLMSPNNGFGNLGKGYGYFGEWRISNGHFEYRSLSGTILSIPELYLNVVTLIKGIVASIYELLADIDKDDLRAFILPAEIIKDGIPVRPLLYSDTFTNWERIPLARKFGCIESSGNINEYMNKSSRSIINTHYIKNWEEKLYEFFENEAVHRSVSFLAEILTQKSERLEKLKTIDLKTSWR